MKSRLILISICVLGVLLVGNIFVKNSESTASTAGNKSSHSDRTNKDALRAAPKQNSGEPSREPLALEEQIDALIKDQEFDRLARLLAQDERRVLEHLVALGVYSKEPENLKYRDTKIDAVIIGLTTALTNHFAKKASLQESIESLEPLQEADLLHGYITVDLFQHSLTPEDAEFVWKWIKNNPNSQAAKSGGSTAALLLLQHDRDHAWQKSLQLPEGHTRQVALNALVYEISRTNMQEAIELINTSRDLPDTDPAISHLIKQAMMQDYDHSYLVQIANASSDGHLRAVNLHEVIMDWAREDSENLQEWLSKEQENWPSEDREKIAAIVDNALIHAQRHHLPE